MKTSNNREEKVTFNKMKKDYFSGCFNGLDLYGDPIKEDVEDMELVFIPSYYGVECSIQYNTEFKSFSFLHNASNKEERDVLDYVLNQISKIEFFDILARFNTKVYKSVSEIIFHGRANQSGFSVEQISFMEKGIKRTALKSECKMFETCYINPSFIFHNPFCQDLESCFISEDSILKDNAKAINETVKKAQKKLKQKDNLKGFKVININDTKNRNQFFNKNKTK